MRRFTSKDRAYMAKLVQEEGQSGPEIAKRMKCSTTTVYNQLDKYAVEHGMSKDALRIQPHGPYHYDDPQHKTWPIGSHASTSPMEEVPEAGIEDTAVTAIVESPMEEVPEAGIEDTAVTAIVESPMEEVPEAGIEDTAVTAIVESPMEEVPEAGIEDTAVTAGVESPKEEIPEASVEDAAEGNNTYEYIKKLINKIHSIIAKNNEMLLFFSN